MTRSGAQYLSDLAARPRSVWLGDNRVEDVTAHPAFANTAQSFAQLYDLATTNPRVLRESASGQLMAFNIARSAEELALKRHAYDAWARPSFGFLGRSADYMAAGFAGFAARADTFRRDGFDGSSSVLAQYQRLREGDLFVGFTITNPTTNRAVPIGEQSAAADLVMRVQRETDEGIVVSGAKNIGTGAIFADEIVVGTIEPLHAEDIDYAFTLLLDPTSEGVHLISRASYEQAASSPADNPLSHRFDENDALLVCQDVLVPWDRVLTYRDVAATGEIWWGTPAYTNMAHQAAVRFAVKAEFIAGLAMVVAQETGVDRNPGVRAELGKLVSHAHIAAAIAPGAECQFEYDPGDGEAVRVNQAMIFAQRHFAAEVYPQMLHQLRMLCGGSLIQHPESIIDLDAPIVGNLLHRYSRTAGQDAQGRIKLMKLVWDVVGSEFATRHSHYEQFYQGAPHVYLNQSLMTPAAATMTDFARGALDATFTPAEQ